MEHVAKKRDSASEGDEKEDAAEAKPQPVNEDSDAREQRALKRARKKAVFRENYTVQLYTGRIRCCRFCWLTVCSA